jgi:hypothetical protein
VIGRHVQSVLGRIEELVGPGSFLLRGEAFPHFAQPWNLDDYESPFS